MVGGKYIVYFVYSDYGDAQKKRFKNKYMFFKYVSFLYCSAVVLIVKACFFSWYIGAMDISVDCFRSVYRPGEAPILFNRSELYSLVNNNKVHVNKTFTDCEKTLLWLAVERGEREAVRILLERGADVNKGDSKGITPLFVAVMNGISHTNILKMLLFAGADYSSEFHDKRFFARLANPDMQLLIANVCKAKDDMGNQDWLLSDDNTNNTVTQIVASFVPLPGLNIVKEYADHFFQDAFLGQLMKEQIERKRAERLTRTNNR